MKCIFCGEDTMNKASNQPMCKEHQVEARRLRDKHNEKVEKLIGKEKYRSIGTIGPHALDHPLVERQKTTAGYHLNKMFRDKKESIWKKLNPLSS